MVGRGAPEAQPEEVEVRAADAEGVARWRAGLASLVELEDARRTSLAAQTALVSLQQERMTAWIALYRAVGGGWDPSQTTANAR